MREINDFKTVVTAVKCIVLVVRERTTAYATAIYTRMEAVNLGVVNLGVQK